MEQHGMFVDTQLLDEPEMASFRDIVMSVAQADRPSGRKPESEKRWQNRIKKSQSYNEATMLGHILPLVIKTSRQAPGQHSVTHQESSGHQQFDEGSEDFEDSGLDWMIDQEFLRTYLPNAYTGAGYDEEISKSLAKDRGMKNPKPDRTYGLVDNAIPRPKNHAALLRDQTKELMNAIPGLKHVFSLIEGVASSGSMVNSINQACRGGTVAVIIQRLLLAKMGQLWMEPGPDRKTYVYTATIDSSNMNFWVNFAYVKVSDTGAPTVSYHMEHVFTYAFRSTDALLYLRRVCHNILDWGV